MLRINDEIVRVASDVIQNEMADPRVKTVVSVMKAETTSDLKFCKIFVSVLSDEKGRDEAIGALNKASGFLRKRIAEVINLRNTPEITIVPDDSIERGMRMHKLIDDVNRPVREREAAGEDGGL